MRLSRASSEPNYCAVPGERVGQIVQRDRPAAAPLILHVVFRLDVGGLENGLVNLISHLPADEYAHVIVCLTDYSPGFRRRLLRDDVTIYSLNKREGKDWSIYLRFWMLMRRIRPDMVHTRNLGAIDLLPIAALAGVRNRIHGEHGWDVHDLDGRRRKYRWLRRVVSPFADRFVAVSGNLRDWLVDTVGLSAEKVAQIYNGVDATHFVPAPRSPRIETDLVVGTIGRMETVKDPGNLAEAFIGLLTGRPALNGKVRLVMVGDGSLLPEVQSRLQAAGLSESVEFCGKVEDVREQLQRFDLFVLPSRNEGISNTILEAMACGLPVVATDVGGNPELVVDGETGVLVPAGDPVALAGAIGLYVDRPDLRSKHGMAGRRRAEQCFSLEAMVNAYRDLYRELLGAFEARGA